MVLLVDYGSAAEMTAEVAVSAAAAPTIDYAFIHDCACDFTSKYNLSDQAHHDLESAMQVVARNQRSAMIAAGEKK